MRNTTARHIVFLLCIPILLVFTGVLGAAPVKVSGSNILDNTLSPPKMQRTGGAPTDNQVPAYDNATGRFKWITPSVSGSGTPAGSSGQLQFNDNGAFGAIPGSGFNKTDNTTTLPGSLQTADPGNGFRRLTLLSNTSYTSAANENSVLMLSGVLNGCENGVLMLYSKVTSTAFLFTDNFVRANENPLSNAGKWKKIPTWDNLQIVSNALRVNTADTYSGAYWDNTIPISNDQYASVTCSDATGSYYGMGVRLDNAALNGYFFQTNALNAAAGYIHKYTNGVQSTLVTMSTLSKATGVKYRIKAVGTTITVDENTGAGWVQKGTATDASFTSGRVGVFEYSSVVDHITYWEGGSF